MFVKFTQSALEVAPLKKDKKTVEHDVFVNSELITHVDSGEAAQSHENDVVKTRVFVVGGGFILVDESETDVMKALQGKKAAAAAD